MRYEPEHLRVKQPFAVLPPTGTPHIRNRKILKVLWWTLPLAVLAFVVGVWLVGLAIWSHVKVSNAPDGQWAETRAAYSSKVLASRAAPERWLADYNQGTASLHLGEIEEGIVLLEEAYEGVPKAVSDDSGALQPYSYECQVRMNLSAGFEMWGDEVSGTATAEGTETEGTETEDTQTEEAEAASESTEEAIGLYEQALAWVEVCQIGGGSSGSDGDGGESGQDGADQDGQDPDGSDQDSSGQDGSGQQDTDQGDDEPGDQFGAQAPQEGNPGGEASDRIEQKIRDLEEGDDGSGSGSQSDQSGDGREDEPFGNESPADREKREELEGKNQEQRERQREKEESANRNPGAGGW